MTQKLNRERTTRVKADEALKMLFSLSKQPVLDLVNGLFDEQYQMKETEVVQQNVEFIQADMSVIFADWVLSVQEGAEVKQFHVEFQLSNPASMVVRMFEYGFHIAKDSAKWEGKTGYLRFPKQLVLYLERDDSIQEHLSCVVEFPPYTKESSFQYRVPVKKFWNLRVEELREQLYALIPFNAFSSRKVMSDIHHDPDLFPQEKGKLMNEEFEKVKAVIAESQHHLLTLYGQSKLTEEDLNKMSTVTVNLFRHLYDKFFAYNKTISSEVYTMVKSVLNVEAIKRSKQQWMQQGLREGMREGELKSKREDLLNILQAKQFARDEIVAKIAHERDAERLSQWVVAAATIADYGEFEKIVIGQA